MTPTFAHSPMHKRYSMIAYGGGQPLEFMFSAIRRTPRGAMEYANGEARWQFRTHFILRHEHGRVIYDGPVWFGDMPVQMLEMAA